MEEMAGEDRSDCLCFFVNGKKVTEKHADPETMLLAYIRGRLKLTGTKYGCGGGGCGACTVMVSRYQTSTKTILHYSANACLLPICQLHGAAVTTVEGIGNTKTRLHPVQERIAKAHGSQCGFCTPGMVMSMYTLLRNKPQPTLEDITQALGGNLCRCTGYRPIVDGCRTFCQETSCCQVNGSSNCCLNRNGTTEIPGNDTPQLFNKEDFMLLDPTQELIFPPELIMTAETSRPRTHTFQGERMTLISPVSLEELVQLKTNHPKAPLVMGNTNIGLDVKFKGILHPVMLSATRVQELFEVTQTPDGLWVGAGLSLSRLRSQLEGVVKQLPVERTELFQALLQQLDNLAGEQIRNVASLGGNVASAHPNSDLNPVLAAGNCKLSVISVGGRREVALNTGFFIGFGKTALQPDDIIVSVFIPFTRKWEFVRAFRQAPRKENSFATVNAGIRVKFAEGSGTVQELSIFYGGMGPSTVNATKTCTFIIGKPWEEQTLNKAYGVLLEEIVLPPSAPGGKVDFRRSLTLSLLFKFFLQMQQELKELGVITGCGPEKSGIRALPKQIQSSVQEFQHVPEAQSEQDPVGRPMMHRSAISHATGEAIYVDDMPQTEGELALALVTSTRPYAKIIDIDVSETLQQPGVVDVITSADIPGMKSRFMLNYVEELLAEKEVSCVGQMVCAVVADTKAHAKRGAAAVKISYEDLPDPVFTVEEAIKKKSFYEPERFLETGNVIEAFGHVDQVYEGELRIGGQKHFYMETQSMLVVPVGEEREFKAYVSTQHPAYVQEAVAETLGVPSNRISCHVKRVGGAFGGKLTKTTILACITAVAAWKTERPVRCVLERGEDMLITGGRHPMLVKYKVGFMNDGRIVAVDIQYCVNAGNTSDESPLVVDKIVLHTDNAYSIPNMRVWGAAYRTNMPSNTAFRGFGAPQAFLAIENLVNDVAMALGRAADEIREINMYSGLSRTHYKVKFDSENLKRCWDDCKVKSDYSTRCKDIGHFNRQSRWKKRGLAIVPIKFGITFTEGFLNQGAALVHIYKDGSVLVSHGGTEMGQGLHTKMQQVASRELHLPTSKIYICETSTSSVPNASPSAASFGTDANGMAVKNACQTLYQRLEPIRKKNPEGSWESWVTKAYFEKISLSATGYYRGPDTYMDWEKMEGEPYAYFVFGACCSEVELDVLTGDYRTVRTDMVMDIGQSINPSVDIGQIEGAFIQGLGLFTMEELQFSPTGLLYTRGPSQYKIPAICDIPLVFNIHLLPNSYDSPSIYSSKGIGEPTLSLGSAVLFAIKDAVAAARLDSGLAGPFSLDSPATPERACLACATAFTQKVPAAKPGSFKPWALTTP